MKTLKACIEVDNVSKQFGKAKAVSEISFTVLQGQISAFLGPNGAGKSTTMNMLSTLLIPTSGKISIEGYSMEEQQEQIKWLIGVVFQEDVLDSELTVYENLYYRGSLYYERKQQVLKRIEEVISLLSLEKLVHKKYGTCSGGQKRICQIARALMSKPKLLLLDEPTIGLDPIARKQVWEALMKLNRLLKMTIFFSTHYIEETMNADHICMINQGRILVCGKKDWVLKEYQSQGSLTIQDIYIDLLSEDLRL
ncbi:ABC transporter ATP-binding protein [Clostridium sp. Marseille-P299]|uniref:ABC transporter ATP-binding protein n=1 Tax=Clostridium sp. Marseille-P299 TaxID=1805477 RepID=UPI00082F8677|nr:ABC transporter ATP-binding protein [Clostridium sp. Marseille-P299]